MRLFPKCTKYSSVYFRVFFLGRVFFVESDRCFLGKTGSLIMANRIKVVCELLVPIPLYQRAFSSPEPVFLFGDENEQCA